MKNNEWTPINSGLLPKEEEVVQISFIGYNDGKPYCDGFAYIKYGNWYWIHDDSPVEVRITAWKYNCEPYVEE